MTDPTPIGDAAAAWTPPEPTPEPDQHTWLRSWSWEHTTPARYRDATVDDLDGPAAAAVADWRTDPTRNLLLLGDVGVGKTHAAMAAARLAVDQGWDVVFHPVVELLDLLRPGGPDDALPRAVDAGLLVLDDVGAERPSDWTAERLYLLVNRRWLEHRPVVATSNLDAAGGQGPLVDAVGARLYSRLVHGAVIARLGGGDRRRR